MYANEEENDIAAVTVIPVYCTATLENCPDEILNNEYGESIRRFLSSEPHLIQNISSVDPQHLSSRSLRNNTHIHTVSVTMYVRTIRLCQLFEKTSWTRKLLGKIKWNQGQAIADTPEVGTCGVFTLSSSRVFFSPKIL